MVLMGNHHNLCQNVIAVMVYRNSEARERKKSRIETCLSEMQIHHAPSSSEMWVVDLCAVFNKLNLALRWTESIEREKIFGSFLMPFAKWKAKKRVWMINLHALAEKFHANNEHWSKHAKSCCCVNQWCKLSKQSNPYQFIREMVSHLLIFVWLCSFDSSPSHRNPNWNDGAMGYDRISATTTSVTSRR